MCAHIAVRHQLARGRCNLQLAEVDGSVALRVGSVDDATGGQLACEQMRGRAQIQSSGDSYGFGIAVEPGCGGGAVDERGETQPLKGGWLTMSRMVSSVTFLNSAATLPLTGIQGGLGRDGCSLAKRWGRRMGKGLQRNDLPWTRRSQGSRSMLLGTWPPWRS